MSKLLRYFSYILIVTVISAGCSTVNHGYPGKRLPESELSRIWTPRMNIIRVDDFSTTGLVIKTNYIIPGEHILVLQFVEAGAIGGGYSVRTATKFRVRGNFEKGKTYYLHETFSQGTLGVRLLEMESDFVIPRLPIMFGSITKDIEDAKSLGKEVSIDLLPFEEIDR